MAQRRPPISKQAQGQGRAQIITLAKLTSISQANQRRLSRVGGEWGASGTRSFDGIIRGEDHNTALDGKNGVLVFDEMERSDAQIGAAVDLIKLPMRGAVREIQPPEKDPTDTEKAIAEACQYALFGEGVMQEEWDFYYRHLLMRVDKGFGMIEKVWFYDEDSGLLRWQRLAPRLPRTVNRWIMEPNGRLKAVEQYVSVNGRFEYRQIPSEYLVLSVREREGDNYFGRSVLRRLWKHWFYKDDAYRIDGVRLDRFGVGIPIAEIDPMHPVDEAELGEIELMLQAMRSNERGYIMTPNTIKFRIMTPEGEGGAMGLMESVEHHNKQILRGVLATFMSDAPEGLNSNKTRTLADIFLHALDAEDRSLNGDIHTQLIRPFCTLNFDMTKNRFPRIITRGIKDVALDVLAERLPELVTGTVVTPTDDIEAVLRKGFGLEPLPEGYKRPATKPEPPAPKALPAPDDDEPPEPVDPEELARSISSRIVELSRHPEQQQPGELADALKVLALAIQKEPPKLPEPIDVEAIIKKTIEANRPDVKITSIERDAEGRMVRVITEPVEFYRGQPRQKGKFATGKLHSGKAGADKIAALKARTGMTAALRGSSLELDTEAADPAFQAAKVRAIEDAQDADASDFEKMNPVAVARAQRASDAWFEEVNAEGSQGFHRDPETGGYTAERQAVHDEIIGHFESQFGAPQEYPVAVVTGGLPGAGKTAGLRQTVDLDRFTNVNSDDVKTLLPEYNGANAAWLHEESDHVARIVLSRAVDRRQNVIIDTTMRTGGSGEARMDDGIVGRVKALRERGYDVRAQFTEVPLKTSSERAMNRYVREGRFVPPGYIRTGRSTSGRFSSRNRETFESVKELVNGWSVFDNSGGPGQFRTIETSAAPQGE